MNSRYHPLPLSVSPCNNNERNGGFLDRFVSFEFCVGDNWVEDGVLFLEGGHFHRRIACTDSNDLDPLRQILLLFYRLEDFIQGGNRFDAIDTIRIQELDDEYVCLDVRQGEDRLLTNSKVPLFFSLEAIGKGQVREQGSRPEIRMVLERNRDDIPSHQEEEKKNEPTADQDLVSLF